MRTLVLAVAGVVAVASNAFALEGKWTPEQVLEMGDPQLQRLGLKVPTRKLWNKQKGRGLLAGAVWVNGCSGSFVSETGLILTNHHCLFSILQQHSTPERDLIRTGYLARTRAEELPGLAERVRVPLSFTDVTSKIRAAVPEDGDDLARSRAVHRAGEALVAECEKAPGRHCEVATFDSGLWYTLVEYLEISDLRLVYAPPRRVGEFGGEVDNWSWPRHTPDFAIARAYVGRKGEPNTYWEHNVPYRPEFFFPVSTRGVKPGDFVMLVGYPRQTWRGLIAAEVAERVERYYPARREVYAEWERLMDQAAKGDARGEIAVSTDVKQLQNRKKHAVGMLAAFERGKILEAHRAREQEVVQWAKKRRGFDAALKARADLEKRVAAAAAGFDRDFLLEHLELDRYAFSKSLMVAATVARAARERAKPDLERADGYSDRDLPLLASALDREQQRLFVAADQAVTVSFIRRALKLPRGQRIAAVDQAFGQLPDAELPAKVASLYARTRLFDAGERKKMLAEDPGALKARKDPLVDLGLALAKDLEALSERRARMEGAAQRLRPVWRKLVNDHSPRMVDPDANRTLRVSFAHVRGYEPADGVSFRPVSTLGGLISKVTGKPPFAVPPEIVKAVADGRYGRWRDASLEDVPVNFLSDADTTNGNSGSAVLNARGELVGVNFDRVWENVANDFGYNPEIARNISADVRCLLWMLDQVLDADELLRELGVRKGKRRGKQTQRPL